MKVRLSLGSSHVLGLQEKRVDAPVTAVHFMVGENCSFCCAFCPQGRHAPAGSSRFLSRISWPEFPLTEVIEHLEAAYQDSRIDRACVQVVHGGDYNQQVEEFFRQLRSEWQGKRLLPVSVNTVVSSVPEAQRLFVLGAHRLGLALDAATAELFARYKGGSQETWLQRLELLAELAEIYPGRISTHLIVGLGETERQLTEVMDFLRRAGVTLALFAFTPVRNTAMEDHPPPSLSTYRRVQLVNFGLSRGIISAADLSFDESGRIVAVPDNLLQHTEVLQGRPFETTGCSGCNRPYYNERPGQTPYNYPQELTPAEADAALQDTQLPVSRGVSQASGGEDS